MFMSLPLLAFGWKHSSILISAPKCLEVPNASTKSEEVARHTRSTSQVYHKSHIVWQRYEGGKRMLETIFQSFGYAELNFSIPNNQWWVFHGISAYPQKDHRVYGIHIYYIILYPNMIHVKKIGYPIKPNHHPLSSSDAVEFQWASRPLRRAPSHQLPEPVALWDSQPKRVAFAGKYGKSPHEMEVLICLNGEVIEVNGRSMEIL